MDKTIEQIKLSFVFISPILYNALGGWDVFIKTLIALTVADFLTGILAGLYTKQLSSSIGHKGIIKKICLYIAVYVACQLDLFFNTQMVLRTSTIGFFVAIEGISIVENLGKMDIPLPGAIKKVLVQLKEKSDSKNTN